MFSKGEVVWAKIRGYPWWPGIVARIFDTKDGEKVDSGQEEVLVNFIGENSHATVPIDKVAPFEKYFNEYANNMKKKKLLDSIQIAKKILNGETTYESERQRLDSFMKQNTDKVVLKRRKSESITNSENSESEMPELEQPSSEQNNELESNKSSGTERKEEIKKKLKVERTISAPEKPVSEKSRVTRSSNKDPASEKLPVTRNASTASSNLNIPNNQSLTTNTLVINTVSSAPAIQKEKPEKEASQKEPVASNRTSSMVLKQRRANSKLQISESEEEMEEENTLISKPLPGRLAAQPQASFEDNVISLENALKRNILFLLDGKGVEKEANPNGMGKRSNEKMNSSRETLPKLLTETITAYTVVSGFLGVQKNLISMLSNNIGKHFKLLDFLLREKKFVSKHVKDIEDISKDLTSRLMNEFFNYDELYKSMLEEVSETKKRKENKPPFNGMQEERERSLRLKSSTVKENQIIKTKISGGEMTSSASSVGVFNDVPLGKKDRGGLRTGEMKLDLKKLPKGNGSNISQQSRNTGVELDKKEFFSEEEEISSMDNLKRKRDDKTLENLIKVEDPSLRKKICIKMAKIIQERYSFDKQKARDLTLKLELKVRSLNPDMRQEYRNKILTIFKILKTSTALDLEKIVNEDSDFNEILTKVESQEQMKPIEDDASKAKIEKESEIQPLAEI